VLDSLPQSLLSLLLLVAVAAISWWLGRRGRPTIRPSEAGGQYAQGVNRRLTSHDDSTSEDPGRASLQAPETREVSMVTANLLRQKGDLEAAINMHQHLLSAPSLSPQALHHTRLELSRDYIAAGQLERAERLLKDLLDEAPELRHAASLHLMEIYQDEQEWQQAIDTGLGLLPKKSLFKANTSDSSVLAALSHYYCELATLAMAKNDFHAVRAYLKQALGFDRNCVRASLLLGEAEYNSGHYAHAVKVLRKIRYQDPLFISESIVLLARCYEAQGKADGLYVYLQECMVAYPSASLLLVLADEKNKREGSAEAARYVGEALKRQDSLRGVARLIDYYIADSEGKGREDLAVLKQLTAQLLDPKSEYQCHACGFLGRHNHWLCPACDHWGQMKPVQD
jgi:lipopolysaccharide biosynthesis regulator YciM